MKTFYSSILFTLASLIVAFFVGYFDRTSVEPSIELGLKAVFIAFVLTVLEISLSFDNAVVNASVLQKMSPTWQRRFLTWGILIAVFGMRLIFPLAIVAVIADIGPLSALKLSMFEPKKYSEIMLSTHHMVSAFGGAFLFLVCLRYFFDPKKETHWISGIEKLLSRLGKMEALELALVLMMFIFLSKLLPSDQQMEYLYAAIWGIVVFVLVDGLASLFETEDNEAVDVNKVVASGGLGLFLYLEVLDASFSFDGVVGAFAITQNLFIIMLGLGSGAFFVRSMTIYLVEKKTLHQFAFLEHGAFWAIGALGLIMIASPFLHVSEWITGFVGVLILALSIWSSRRHSRAEVSGSSRAK
ncbi:MAG: DUF475 domain-containing protein [Bdellovibrionales bacterium]